ncbi:MAG: hypothetical protein KTM48_01540, partial [Wolbachia endosymbiont of Pissodes strobi]|nr:hypothetical protein [Wolbachia endosymbiont of Pissodes strobi]
MSNEYNILQPQCLPSSNITLPYVLIVDDKKRNFKSKSYSRKCFWHIFFFFFFFFFMAVAHTLKGDPMALDERCVCEDVD